MRPYLILACFLVAGAWPGIAEAQEPEDWCPPEAGTANADTLIHLVERIVAEAPRESRDTRPQQIASMFWNTFGEVGPCPRLRPDLEQGEVLATVLEVLAAHPDEEVARLGMHPVPSLAFALADELPQPPEEMLLDLIETARSHSARWRALLALVRESTDPDIRALVLDIARSPSGPPGWRGLPEDLIEILEFMGDSGARMLDEELKAAPERIANPWARWALECARGHAIPRPLEDPCHPQNAPERTPSPGGGPG